MSKSILIPVEKTENIIGVGNSDYDILTKDDVKQILKQIGTEGLIDN